MAVMIPINLSPNGSTVDAEQDVTISWRNSGDRQYHFNLKIYESATSSLVYESGKTTTFNTFTVIPANTLTNGVVYKYTVTIYNQLNETATSDWVLFECSSSPTCSFTNITDGGEILNSAYTFEGSYIQDESVDIRSWLMILYDSEQEILSMTDEQFSDDISHEFAGLNNEDDYYVELQVRSQKGLLGTTGKIHFTTRYEIPANVLELASENVAAKAGIRLSWNVIQIIGRIFEGNITYQDNEKVNLTNGTIIFDDIPNIWEFAMKLWFEWGVLNNTVTTETISTAVGDVEVNTRSGTTELMRLSSNIGDIWLEFRYESDTEGRLYLWKNIYGELYHLRTSLMNPSLHSEVYVGIKFDGSLCRLVCIPTLA